MQSSQERKYTILTNILDGYVREGVATPKRKSFFDTSTEEKLNQARSRAFIHLYLAATYGILDFKEREHVITDASRDGGIDAYFIDCDNKVIDIIQSKFRIGAKNFESKYIEPEEIVAIDLHRIMGGFCEDKNGNDYNGYILNFIQKINKISDMARYRTRVTVLANVKEQHFSLLTRLFSGDETNILNFDRCYSELVLPTIRGEQHYKSSMRLQVDISNKSTGSRLSAEIATAYGPSQVTVVLVPTLEIAEIMHRYKNSILRYNPRSYLEFKEQKTNDGIRNSIINIETGDFAILNNGITIVSDETYFNERVGAKNKAQVEIVNPQIINGGQTAFTLSRIYEESSSEEKSRIFLNKDVLLRIITVPQVDEVSKKELIFSISSATNSQTAVSAIDRSSSNDGNREIAELVFRKTGFLYEPKRGEYFDALRHDYILKEDVIERSLFSRLMHIACGDYELALEKRMMRKTGGLMPGMIDETIVGKFLELYEIYLDISGRGKTRKHAQIEKDLAFSVFVVALKRRRVKDGATDFLPVVLEEAKNLWNDFICWGKENVKEFSSLKLDKNTGAQGMVFSVGKWIKSRRFLGDVDSYVDLLVPENLLSMS